MITLDTPPAPDGRTAATVTCDVPGCGELLRVGPAVKTSIDAWWQAQDRGWANRTAPGSSSGVRDLCPYHATRPAYLEPAR